MLYPSRQLVLLVLSTYVCASSLLNQTAASPTDTDAILIHHGGHSKRASEFDKHKPNSIVFAVLIPVLVLLSGVFAGLTLGYMSLDETQLNVLSISGTPSQREYANKIKPIRKNGHLLLVTLLLANMIVNESLPIISDPVLGGGAQSVVVSTVLIVIFAEIIPQSLFTRHGLYLGAKMAGFTKVLIYTLGIISYPVAKLLEFVLGSHHGIIYRRAELKELIAMHSSHSSHGGDLKRDTVAIIGATLDLQEKVVRQAMTPIEDVFMLSIDSKLDYDLLKKICLTGHSRVPVYEEVDVPVRVLHGMGIEGAVTGRDFGPVEMRKLKKIVGILLVKQCVLLDPKDSIPLRKIPLNKVPFVPNNEPLLGILDKFQEGRSHMAIVSRFSVEKAASVKKAVKRGLTQRLRQRVGMGDSSDSDSDSDEEKGKSDKSKRKRGLSMTGSDKKHTGSDDATLEDSDLEKWKSISSGPPEYGHEDDCSDHPVSSSGGCRPPSAKRSQSRRGGHARFKIDADDDLEKGIVEDDGKQSKSRRQSMQLEQNMPADAVLAKEGADEFLQITDPAVMPLGIITLEDVLEELIGEEIYDEFDPQGAHGDPYVPVADAVVTGEPQPKGTDDLPASHATSAAATAAIDSTRSPPLTTSPGTQRILGPPPVLKPIALKGFNFFRPRSAPPVPREDTQAHASPSDPSDDNANRDGAVYHMGGNGLEPADAAQEGSSMTPPSYPEAAESLVPVTVPQAAVTTSGHFAAPMPVVLAHSAQPAVPRGGSPVPALQAMFLERMRRHNSASASGSTGPAVAASATTVPSVTVTRPGSAPVVAVSGVASAGGGGGGGGAPNAAGRPGSTKGTRFKSSPLGGGERMSVVVAEKVKEDMAATVADSGGDEVGEAGGEAVETREAGESEVCIPSEKDKVGPDKQG